MKMMYRMDISKIPTLLIFGKANETPPWRHGGRYLNYGQIVFITSGECTYEINGESYTVSQGSILFTPPDCHYKLTTKTHCEFFFADFKCDIIPSDNKVLHEYVHSYVPEENKNFYLSGLNSKQIWLRECLILDQSVQATLLSLFVKCQILYLSDNVFDRMMIDAVFYEILLLIGRITANSYSADYTKIPISLSRIISYISDNYAENISLDTMKEKFGLSKEYICKLFRDNLDCTFTEYLNKIKLTNAAELLLNSSMNISQISNYLGFSSVYYFSRIFKNHFLVSPTKYVKLQHINKIYRDSNNNSR